MASRTRGSQRKPFPHFRIPRMGHTKQGCGHTCTVTPSTRTAKAPRRHSKGSKQAFMVAVCSAENWPMLGVRVNRETFKEPGVTQ